MNDPIAPYLIDSIDHRGEPLLVYHRFHLPLMRKAKGSKSKHQAWEGGYYDHILDCFQIAEEMWGAFIGRSKPFTINQVTMVLYFHDIEKLWKYTEGLPEDWDKNNYLENKIKKYGFSLSAEELHAIKYIHGEGDEYCEHRVMSELAAFCHTVDVLSARVWHSWRK